MNLSAPFIRRPVMTTLVMASFTLFGVFAYRSLPVSDLPVVDFPTISVNASLPGASPETMAASVATPLERQFSNIAGIKTMNSSSSQSSTSITLEFDLDRDIDSAALDVQAAISASLGQLPSNMPNPPTFRKVNPADQPILYLSLTSPTLPLSAVNRYAQDLVAQRVATVPGVAEVAIFGAQKYAVRIQLDPRALQARGLGLEEVTAAVRNANANLPTGVVEGRDRAYTVEATGGLLTAADFRQVVVAFRDGAPVRLADLGEVKDGVENDRVAAWFVQGGKDQRSVTVAVRRQPGTNTVRIAREVQELLPTINQQLPAAVELKVIYDRSESIRHSVGDVQFTLLLTLVLVVLVIFLFLRNLPATVIPSLALPVSLVGTFGIMAAMGYSLDNLSLMALTLAVGFVVDDAIVMLENIVRHMERGEAAREAAFRGSKEIAFTILSMTISLAAVFLPILFMGGLVGRLFKEFAVTIGAAILVSGFVSLTLTPLLCARFLKPHAAERHGRLYRSTERAFDAMLRFYDRGLTWSLAHPRSVLAFSAAVLVLMIPLWQAVPKGFLPSEDTGRLLINTEPAEGTSWDAMVRAHRQVAEIATRHPAVEHANSTVRSVSSGFVFLKLKDGTRAHVDQVIRDLRGELGAVPSLRAFPMNPPPISLAGGGGRALYSVTLQDADTDALYRAAPALEARMRALPALADVNSDLRLASPRVTVAIDRDRAAALQIAPLAIEDALYTAFGSRRVSVINAPEDQYDVLMELDPGFRLDPGALSLVYVRSASGKLVPLDAVARLGRAVGPLSVNHAGQLPAVNLSFNLAPGRSLGEAMQGIEGAAAEVLPATVATRFQGTAQAFQESMRGLGLLLVMAVLVIYVVLGILYESFVHPITILTALPFAGFGALVTLLLFRTDLSIYAFVGIIMLVGLVKKNGIMMVDFAIEAQRTGKSPRDAIHEASLVRFRPIMMTSMAALMGTLPIAFGLGAGAESRQPLGLAVVGGLVFSQFLTLYVTPVFYVWMERLRAGLGRRRASTPGGVAPDRSAAAPQP
ncbi:MULTISPECIES: efflux RND transporter permease subunit [Anaeromyxobacter]|uniref:efflux RND transporter permease subunit n=1 Tax=Anaeromyxobacter TaxID=161492 RepID=UPI001F577BC4|nr:MULTISPECIES: efflux RND transporter permease subunit [unclassified Anaeromyxobacter]